MDWGPVRSNRSFRLLISGQLISLIGSNVTMVAIPYQVFLMTHASWWVGVASIVQLPALIAGSLMGGALGDRYDKRPLLVATSATSGFASLLLAVGALHHVALGWLLALAASSAFAGGLGGPLRTAAIPQMLRNDELVPAYSLNQIVVNLGAILGPSLAGLVLASWGLAWCYGLDALTFAVILVASVLISPLPPTRSGSPVSLLRAIGDGVTYVRHHRVAQFVYLADLNAMVFGSPRGLFPAIALTVYHGGPRLLGLLYAAPSVGAVVLAFTSGWVTHVRRRGRAVAVAIGVWGLAISAFGLSRSVWIALPCLALAGAMDVVSTVLRNTILQLAITDEVRSRVSSIQLAVVTGGPRLGDLESGVVASATSTEFSVVSGGVACVIGIALLMRRRREAWTSRDL